MAAFQLWNRRCKGGRAVHSGAGAGRQGVRTFARFDLDGVAAPPCQNKKGTAGTVILSRFFHFPAGRQLKLPQKFIAP
jgi:hypothetical protein